MCYRLKKGGQDGVESCVRDKGNSGTAGAKICVVEQHSWYHCCLVGARRLRRWVLPVPDTKELTELPRPSGGIAPLHLMKQIARGRTAGLNYVVVMPVAVNTDVLCGVGQKVERRACGPLVLVLVLPARLGAGPLTGLDMAQSYRCSGHRHTRGKVR